MLGEHTASFSGAVRDGSSLLLQNTDFYMSTHVTVRQKNKMCLFCDCGHVKAHRLHRQPSHPCPSAPILNSKLLCTAATVANATSHFMVQLPQQSHTVCNCQYLVTGVGKIMCNFIGCWFTLSLLQNFNSSPNHMISRAVYKKLLTVTQLSVSAE